MLEGKIGLAQAPKAARRNDLNSRLKREGQAELEAELERLKATLKVGYELKVSWTPNRSSKLSGEVRGDLIYVYDEDEKAALETLKHEFIDHAISKTIEPYKQVTNRLIAMINEDAYKKKEKLVDALTQLI